MAKSTRSGDYNLRVIVIRRVLGEKQANGEDVEDWPEPAAGASEYYAAVDALSAGEIIAQGFRHSLGFMKIRIKGRSIPIDAADRVKKKVTGEIYTVTGVAREDVDTVISCERLHQQVAGQ